MKLLYEHPGSSPDFPYLLLQNGAGNYYKVLLRNRFLFVSHGATVIERDQGELDIPFVGAGRTPIGDFVYDNLLEASAAFEIFRTSPGGALSLVLAGQKPSGAFNGERAS